MVQRRAGLNRRLRKTYGVHAINVDDEQFTAEDYELAACEEEMELENGEEFEQYQKEVEELEMQLEKSEEPKN